jgi:hypothetical protein
MRADHVELHLAACQMHGRESACGVKVDHHSEARAEATAHALNERASCRHEVEPYPCWWCAGWHVGRVRTAAEWTIVADWRQEQLEQARDPRRFTAERVTEDLHEVYEATIWESRREGAVVHVTTPAGQRFTVTVTEDT